MKKLGLISDVHATAAPVREALDIFSQHHVDHILCAGDTAGYGEQLDATIELLKQSDCQAILGNHDVWYITEYDQPSSMANDYFSQLSAYQSQHIAGKHVYMVHAHPPDACMGGIKLLDVDGKLLSPEHQYWSQQLENFEAEVLIVGHTHQVFAETLGNTLVINPGSTKFNHSCAILSLPDMQVEFFALSNKTIEPSWNWGAYRLTVE